MDRCLYHLDGPQALRYLDRLLEIPAVHAIQWVPGAGRDYWVDWISLVTGIADEEEQEGVLKLIASRTRRRLSAGKQSS
jgi:hypothetical protein